LHFPTLPHPEFAGRTGAGDFADSVAEMDFRVGQIIDALDRLKLSQNTLLMFGSDNGPEFRRPWRGTAGPWSGTYHTAMEGSLRVPFMFRWPGHVPAGRTSNEIVHVTDLFPTLARLVGAELPADRPLDGVDQLDLLLGTAEKSARDGFLFYIKDELRAVKWRNWKMHLVLEREPNDGPIKLESPMIFDLLQDPKEETDVGLAASWVRAPMRYLMREFLQSLKEHPPIPPGAPDDYRPK
jgi:arylsulfatase